MPRLRQRPAALRENLRRRILSLRFLANENFPKGGIDALRRKGHDVLWMQTDAPGSKDPDILARAIAESRILLTFDKDFGEMVFRQGKDASCGVILLRPRLSDPDYVVRFTLAVYKAG